MDIDWVTVAAQIVNFLVLVWLLQHFLYGPITRAMARREQRIEDRLAEAAEKKRRAEEQAQALEKKEADLDQRRDALMEEAREDAKTFRDDLEGQARREVEERRHAWRKQVADERDAFLGELRKSTASHVYELARSALAELADVNAQNQLAARFGEKLRELEPERRRKIRDALGDKGEAILIETGIEISPAAKAQITKTLHEVIGKDFEVTYERIEGLPLGIRLNAAGQNVEWSLGRYLERLEREVETKLQKAAAPKERQAA